MSLSIHYLPPTYYYYYYSFRPYLCARTTPCLTYVSSVLFYSHRRRRYHVLSLSLPLPLLSALVLFCNLFSIHACLSLSLLLIPTDLTSLSYPPFSLDLSPSAQMNLCSKTLVPSTSPLSLAHVLRAPSSRLSTPHLGPDTWPFIPS